MGDEIATFHFTKEDFITFAENLRKETQLLIKVARDGGFSNDHATGGFELEAWLLDKELKPAPINSVFLSALNDPMVGSELAMFNIELNNNPHSLSGPALRLMHKEIEERWRKCVETAKLLACEVMVAGIIPTLGDEDLVPENLSKMKRYRALNDQLMEQRKGRPFKLDIEGEERLIVKHSDVMLEAATTALQIQLQVDFSQSVRFYNAVVILSAPLVAVTANSPFMFSKNLWAETRIPVFEQALGESAELEARGPNRVTFGFDYAHESLIEFFEDNLQSYNVLLPMVFEDSSEDFRHLRLHNGTIWRWNRPLIGFDSGGSRHFRIEHRSMPSGPTIADIMANVAFFFGLAQAYGTQKIPPEGRLPFKEAKENFYACARLGLEANVRWLDGKVVAVTELITEELLPMARRGLEALEIDGADIEEYIGIIEARVATGQNGAVWQRAYKVKMGCGDKDLCAAYLERQKSGAPVHEWNL